MHNSAQDRAALNLLPPASSLSSGRRRLCRRHLAKRTHTLVVLGAFVTDVAGVRSAELLDFGIVCPIARAAQPARRGASSIAATRSGIGGAAYAGVVAAAGLARLTKFAIGASDRSGRNASVAGRVHAVFRPASGLVKTSAARQAGHPVCASPTFAAIRIASLDAETAVYGQRLARRAGIGPHRLADEKAGNQRDQRER